MTWLGWCDDYIQSAIDSGNCEKMIAHKGVVRKRIAAYLQRIKQTNVLLKDVDRDLVSGLFDYMRSYRNRKQIKTNGGRLAAYSLVLFEETVKAIFNKAVRDGLIAYNPVQDLTREEHFHAPDKHREYLTADELKRFLAVEPQTAMEQTVQMAFGFSCMTGLRLGDMQHLRWSDIKDVNGVQMVSIIQHKTKRPVTVPLNTLALSLLPPRPENGEEGIIFPLVKKPDNVAKYVRRIKEKAGIGFHLSQQPTFGGNAGDNGRCGTLFGQQDFGAWQHRFHAGLRKGEHGEESGGNEPDGWGVLMNSH